MSPLDTVFGIAGPLLFIVCVVGIVAGAAVLELIERFRR